MKDLLDLRFGPWTRTTARQRPAMRGLTRRAGVSCWKRPRAAPQGGQRRSPGSASATGRLCTPFARHRGHGPEDAQDLVQGFFQHLIESRALGAVDRAKGRFRSFMLASFQNFMAMERRRAGAEKRGGRAELIRIDWQDAESRIGFEAEDQLTPETFYDARWALELLGRATRRLEQEQAALGKAKTFRTLRPFLGDEGARASLSYEEAAQALNVGLPALKTLIHRLRQRHAQLLREEVARTVLDPDGVEPELHALCEALVQAEGRVRG
jgi:DNA-directed RNA polymerase specialized sigma24 family protein